MPALEQILNFDMPANFAFDATKIEVSTIDDVARLLQNPDLTFGALFSTTGQLNAEVANGDPTASPSGANTLVWHGVDFRGVSLGDRIDYRSAGITTVANLGTVRINFAPAYSGSPASNVDLITLADTFALPLPNIVQILHLSTGQLFVRMRDSTGIILFEQAFGSFVAVQNTEVEIEFDFNLTAGANRVFVAGAQLGATETTTGTRSTGSVFVGLGGQTIGSDSVVKEFTVFDAVKHTAGYVPAAIDLNDSDLVFGGRFRNFTFDADIGTGLTATISGSVRVIHGLDLEGAVSNAHVAYAGTDNVSSANQKGTFKWKVRPDYSGVAPSAQTFFQVARSTASVDNQLKAVHATTGDIVVRIDDRFGAILLNANMGKWVAVAGQEDSFELGFDLDLGDIRLFLNKVLLGSASSITGTRTSTQIGHLRIGNQILITPQTPEFFLRDFAVYDTVQHTADFTDESILVSTDDPIITPGGTTSIDSFNSFAAVTTAVAPDEVRFVQEINGQLKWFDGVAWVNSDGSLAQSNTAADANTNAGTLGISLGVRYRPGTLLHSQDGVSTPTAASVTFGFDFFSFEADASDLRTAVVFGFVKDTNGNPVANVKVIIEHNGFFHGDHLVQKETRFVLSDIDGFFEVAVVETQSISLSPYTFIVDEVQRDKVQVPDQISVSLGTFVVNP